MKDSFKKLFEILPSGDKWKMLALFGLMMIAMFLEIAGIGMLPVFVSSISDPDYIFNNEYIGPILQEMGWNTSRELLLYGGGVLIAIFFVKIIYLIWFQYIKTKFVLKRYSSISKGLYENYLSAPYTFHLNRNTSELIRNVTNETRFIASNIMLPFITISMNIVTILGIFVLLMAVEPIISVLSLFFIGGGGFIAIKTVKNKLRHYGEVAKNERARMIQAVTEGVGGIKDIALMNRQKYFMDRFSTYIKNLTDADIFRNIAAFASRPVVEFIAVIGLVFVAGAMILQGRETTSIIPILALFGGAIVRLVPAASLIMNEYTKMKFFGHSLDAIYEDVRNLKDNKNNKLNANKSKSKLPFNKNIQIHKLSYTYPNSHEKALSNINIKIRKGSSVGFVGESGAGKSTIVDIILGILEPQQGTIFVDGVDVFSNIRDWQNNLGYIPQFIYLSDDTIRNNIAFGLPEKDISDEKIEKAISAAQLKRIIYELPNGLNTMIGENGVRLSGGQRQRIGIARALYNNPAVLIMDEATSALDNITEKQVVESIEKLKGERTIITIAHRLTTVHNCDSLYLMKNGKIIDNGDFDDLLKKSNEFREMNVN